MRTVLRAGRTGSFARSFFNGGTRRDYESVDLSGKVDCPSLVEPRTGYLMTLSLLRYSQKRGHAFTVEAQPVYR